MKKYFNKLILFTALAVGLYSCQSTLDINESEVDATVESVAPDLLLAGAITAPRGQFSVTTSELGSIMMNQWGPDVNNVTGGMLDEFRLNITQNFYTSIWQNLYRGMGTYQAIISYSEPGYDNHKAIARILKSYYMQYIVDLYGDCPYSEAFQFGDNYTPAYDDDMAIYRALIVDIDTALETLNMVDNPNNPVGSEDIVFGGDLSGWIKFANTLKLRILMRESESSSSATYLAEQFAALDQNFLTSDALITPPYANADGQQEPFYANYGYTPTGEDTFDNDYIVPSEYMAKFLQGDITENGISTGVVDNRILRLFTPIPGASGPNGVVGVQQGATNTTAPPELSELGPGLLVGSDQPNPLFTAAESYFLQAEAAHRYPSVFTGNAQSLFHAGITASFNRLGAPGASAYINDSENVNLIGWTGSSNKIEAIMTQKWIASCGYNAIESWIEFTRTGYPNVPLSIIAEQPARPVRLLYPAQEYSTNSANVPSQSASDAFSDRVFWNE